MFETFWKLYPRRVAKKDAFKAWSKLTEEQKAKCLKIIPEHIKMWDAEGRGIQFTPYPASYLNGERFEDEIELPQPKLTTSANVLEFAKERKIEAKPGESMDCYLQRVRMTR